MKMLAKLQKRIQEGKKDNKGFSLVELIIVIAIMAILIGIVGMNVIPQIENARKGTDAEVLSALVTEAMEAWTQVEYASGTKTLTIGMNSSNQLTFSSDGSAFQDKFAELANFGSREMKSTAGKALFASGASLTITCDETHGVYIGSFNASDEYVAPAGFEGYEFRSR